MSLLDCFGPHLGHDPYADADHLRAYQQNLLEVKRLASGDPRREALLESILDNPQYPHQDEEVWILLARFRRDLDRATVS